MKSGVALLTQAEQPVPRFNRANYFPPDWQEMVSQFLSLFHRYSYILKPIDGGAWFSANESWALSDTEILKAISGVHPKYVLGTRAGRATRFAVLDIDAGSKYHNKESVDQIRQILASTGIEKTVVYRSSYSDGWHLYIFFDEPISSKDLRNQLVQLFTLKGFEVAKGKLEIFPHPGQGASIGQGLRLPLQPGFAWIDQQTFELEYDRAEFSPTKALTYFLDELEMCSNTRNNFHRMKSTVERLNATREQIVAQFKEKPAEQKPGVVLPFKRPVKDSAATEVGSTDLACVFGALPPGIMPDIWTKGRQYASTGLTGPAQRADAIYCLNHYLFYGDPEHGKPALGYGYADERAWAVEQILHEKHNGQSKDITRATSDSLAQITRAANWIPPHKRGEELKPYEIKMPVAYIRHNAKQAADARQRIQKALDEFVELKQPFSIRDLMQKSGCWEKTLYRHEDLWRGVQEKLRNQRFAAVAPEYNAGEGAGSQKTCPTHQPTEKITPAGLLAARRIVHEISMRTEREKQRKLKSALRRSEASENDWVDKIKVLTEKRPSELPIERLKSLLVVLIHYLNLAPCEEEATSLHAFIQQMKIEIQSRNSLHEIKPESG